MDKIAKELVKLAKEMVAANEFSKDLPFRYRIPYRSPRDEKREVKAFSMKLANLSEQLSDMMEYVAVGIVLKRGYDLKQTPETNEAIIIGEINMTVVFERKAILDQVRAGIGKIINKSSF